MMQSLLKRITAFSLALALILALSACNGRNPANEEPSSSPGPEPDSSGFVNPLPPPQEPEKRPEDTEALSLLAQEKKALNSDTVGWLSVPNTTVSDVVLWYPGDENAYYLRKNFEKSYAFTGVYFADFRSKWGVGRTGLSKNTVIYGHSMEDDPNGPLFSQLKKFLQEDFAKANPYLHFSTTDEDMVWEIFAVFYSNIYQPYNTPDPDDAAYEALLKDARERSLYNYDVSVNTKDKILTLSTCCYNLDPAYPNPFRYVVMAKLVDKDAPVKDTASLAVNPAPKSARE